MARSSATQGVSVTHEYPCLVTGIEPATGSTSNGETPDPVIYLYLTERKGQFVNLKCYLPEVARNEMLAVAIAAISTGFPVTATLFRLTTLRRTAKTADACIALRLTAS